MIGRIRNKLSFILSITYPYLLSILFAICPYNLSLYFCNQPSCLSLQSSVFLRSFCLTCNLSTTYSYLQPSYLSYPLFYLSYLSYLSFPILFLQFYQSSNLSSNYLSPQPSPSITYLFLFLQLILYSFQIHRSTPSLPTNNDYTSSSFSFPAQQTPFLQPTSSTRFHDN